MQLDDCSSDNFCHSFTRESTVASQTATIVDGEKRVSDISATYASGRFLCSYTAAGIRVLTALLLPPTTMVNRTRLLDKAAEKGCARVRRERLHLPKAEG